jgi:hypothetical protein
VKGVSKCNTRAGVEFVTLPNNFIETREMKITFYRSALSSEKGKGYKSPLLSVSVPDTLSREAAVSAAISQFQQHMKVDHWQQLAESHDESPRRMR